MTAPQPPAPAPVYLAPVPPPKAPAAPKPPATPAPKPRHRTPLLVAGCAVAVVAVAGVWALAGPVAGMATAGGLAAAGGAVHATRRLARRRETTRAASARPPGAARPSQPRVGGRAGIRPRGGWPSFGRGRGSAPGGGGDRSPGGGSPGRGRGRGRGRPSWFPGRRGADKQDAARSGDRSRVGQPEGRRKGRQPRGGGKGGAARPGGSGTRGGPASGDGRKSNDHASGSSRRRGWRRFLPGRRGGRPGSGGNSGGSNGSGGGAAPGGKSGGKSAGGTDPASTPGGRRFRDRRRRKPRSDSPPTGGGRGKGGTPAAGGSGRGLRKLVDRLHRSKPAEAKGTEQKTPAKPVPPTRRTGRAAGADGRMKAAQERLAAVMGRQAEKPPEKPAAKGAGRKVCRACHGTGKHPTCGFDAPCPWCTKDLTLRIEPRDGGPAEYVSWSRDQRIWPSDYKSRVYIVDRVTGALTEVTKDPGRSPSPAGPSESAGGGPPPTPAPGTPTRSRRGRLNDSLQGDVDPAQWGAMPPPHPARQRWQDRMDNRGGSMDIQSMRNDWEPLMARWEEKLREAHEISQQAAAAIEGSPVHRGTSDIARELAGLTGQLAGRVPEVTATTRQADEAYWALADGTLDRPNPQAWTAD